MRSAGVNGTVLALAGALVLAGAGLADLADGAGVVALVAGAAFLTGGLTFLTGGFFTDFFAGEGMVAPSDGTLRGNASSQEWPDAEADIGTQLHTMV